jgi:hypothetical protein
VPEEWLLETNGGWMKELETVGTVGTALLSVLDCKESVFVDWKAVEHAERYLSVWEPPPRIMYFSQASASLSSSPLLPASDTAARAAASQQSLWTLQMIESSLMDDDIVLLSSKQVWSIKDSRALWMWAGIAAASLHDNKIWQWRKEAQGSHLNGYYISMSTCDGHSGLKNLPARGYAVTHLSPVPLSNGSASSDDFLKAVFYSKSTNGSWM